MLSENRGLQMCCLNSSRWLSEWLQLTRLAESTDGDSQVNRGPDASLKAAYLLVLEDVVYFCSYLLRSFRMAKFGMDSRIFKLQQS